MGQVAQETVDTLRGIAQGEPAVLGGLLGLRLENLEDSGLDARVHSLVKIATLVAFGAPAEAFVAQVRVALDSGATPEDLAGVLVAVAPEVGIPRIVATAPSIMRALGVPAAPA